MEQTIRLARLLVDLFYPLVELSFFDEQGTLENIYNDFSAIKEDQECQVKNLPQFQPFLELLVTGRQIRCILYPLKNDQTVQGYLRLRYDLTLFKNMHEQLNCLLHTGKDLSIENNSWKESIDQHISQYLLEHKIQVTTSKQKRELISRLQSKGLLDFKESSAYVAAKLQISRATVYNYLKTTADFKKVHIHQVDAFTQEKFSGNPAGVVLDADHLDELTMRKIARELNLSETAFVLPSKKGKFQMRYFTPTGHEIKFCGHSTVGTLFMIAKENKFGIEKSGHYTFDVETSSGMLQMEAFIDDNDGIQVAYETPAINLRPVKISHAEVANAAGFDLRLVDTTLPVMYEETNQDLFLCIHSLENLKNIECDPKSFTQFSKQHNLIALCVFARETFDAQHQFHMRCFAPLVGIPEDPFTGSVLGGLTAYVHQFNLLPRGRKTFQVEQGHFLHRPGVVRVEFSKTDGQYHAKVFAEAVHCFSTEINLS